MSIAVCLLLYSAAVLVFGPPVLTRLTRSGHAPHLAIAAWLAAIASVLSTWLVAAVLVVVDVARHWDSPAAVLAACITRLHAVAVGDVGIAPQSGLLALAAAASAATATLVVRLARAVVRLRGTAHEHARAVHIVGCRTADENVMVLEAHEPAAYCVAGRPPAIVVTTAALAVLDDEQIAAVLAHEGAHLAGHHPQLVSALRALVTVLPRVRLMTVGAAEVSRLLEMCADDVAVRQHGRSALLSGLMGLAGAASAPAAALGAANVAVLSRAERLVASPPALAVRARARTALAISLTVIVAGPMITAVLAASGALLCSP